VERPRWTSRPTGMNIGRLACAAVLALSACSDPASDHAPDEDADQGSGPAPGAVWTVNRGEPLGPDTTIFTAMVRRVDCNNGVTGDVQGPDVRLEDEEVTVTFTVKPVPSGARNCLGNNEVAYVVALAEPLGDRDLVDGQCDSDGEGSRTTFCRPDGVRYSQERRLVGSRPGAAALPRSHSRRLLSTPWIHA
jgi:hypothetical protein